MVEQTAPDRAQRPVQTHTGVDVGLKTFAVLSDGEEVVNLRCYRTQMRKLAQAQRALARKQRGSHNRAKARRALARLHQAVGMSLHLQ